MQRIGRSAAIGLALICTLALSVSAAPSALAASAKNTTPFTCVKVEPQGGEFSDPHCDKKVPFPTGKYAHVEIPPGTQTAAVIGNEETQNETKEASPAVLKGTVFGVKLEVVCKTVSGEATLTGEEPEAKIHRFKTVGKIKKSSCTVAKPAGCKVKEPIELSVTAEGVEGIGAEKNEMGIEFKPTGEHLAQVTIEGCIFAGTFNVDGTAIATGAPAPTEKHTGATKKFTNAMTKETLKLAGNAAELEATTTIRMSGGGHPISFTTVT